MLQGITLILKPIQTQSPVTMKKQFKKEIDMGKLIRKKVEERRLSITEFANRICRSRTDVYDIFARKSLDIQLLITISKVLNHNFIEEIYQTGVLESQGARLPASGPIVILTIAPEEIPLYEQRPGCLILQLIDLPG